MALSPDTETGPEESVRKLEVFLYASTDVRKISSFTFIMEGLILTLYADGEDLVIYISLFIVITAHYPQKILIY